MQKGWRCSTVYHYIMGWYMKRNRKCCPDYLQSTPQQSITFQQSVTLKSTCLRLLEPAILQNDMPEHHSWCQAAIWSINGQCVISMKHRESAGFTTLKGSISVMIGHTCMVLLYMVQHTIYITLEFCDPEELFWRVYTGDHMGLILVLSPRDYLTFMQATR